MRNFSEITAPKKPVLRAAGELVVPDPSQHQRLRFGNYLIDEARGCLMRDGREARLRPKTWQLLAYFAQRPSRLVTRAELIRALWPNLVVCEDSLVQCVSELRHALRDDNKSIIKTVARRGYRFDAELVREESTNQHPANTASLGSTREDSVITLSGAWARLRGLTGRDEITDARRRFERAYQLDETNADALSGLALSHVIEVLHRWSTTPRWQIELAREAANAAIALDGRSALAHHARAHVAMLESCHFEARVGFQKALTLNPSLAHAHLRIGLIELELGHAERTERHVASASRSSKQTRSLESQSAFIAGMAAFHLGKDEDARRHMRNSIRLNPNNGFGYQWLAAIGALHGRADVEGHLLEFCRLTPGHTIESLKSTERSWHPVFRSQRDRLYEGLRRAGLPR
jgi:DNA-binding winged helix-turn-helix (wHTH) protein